MGNAEVVLSLAGTALSLLITCIIFIVRLAKSIKDKKRIQNCSFLDDAVAPLMEIAESFSNYSGEEKKQFVLTKVNQFAIENGLKYDADAITAKVEKLIDLSKKINAKN